jgi:histidinol-phosphatase
VSRVEDSVLTYTSLGGFDERFLALAGRCWAARGFGDFWQYCLLAEGAVDVACDSDMKPWDFAPVQLIVEEAGGRCTTFTGDRPAEDASFLATNGRLHEELVSLLGV